MTPGRHSGNIDEALAELEDGKLSNIGRALGHMFGGRPMMPRGQLRNRARSDSGLEILDYREYAPGEDFHRIDWRQSARLNNPHIRRYHAGTSSDWFVCLDQSASMAAPNMAKWLLGVQIAAAVVYLLLQRRQQVGLLTFSEGINRLCPSSDGRSQFGKALSLLRLSEPRRSGGASNLNDCVAAIGKRCSVFVISDLLAIDGMLNGLKRMTLLGGQVHALQVLSADECKLPTGSQQQLQDIESGEMLTVELDPSALDRATHRLSAITQNLTADCPRSGITYSNCTTESSWDEVIVNHLKKSSSV